MNDWIDIPVVEAMEYFGGVLATASKWAARYAGLIGLIGLLWSAFKLVNSRITIKDLWWDTIFKWVGFLLLMSLYPAITTGFSKIANEVGMKAGAGESAIITSLKSLRQNLSEDLKSQEKWAQELQVELVSRFEDLDLSEVKFENSNSYSDYMNSLSNEISMTKFNSSRDKKRAQELVDEYRTKSKHKVLFSATTLKALNSILIEKEMDGSDGENLTNSYTKLDIWLKDANGDDSYYLSPSAILRVSLLNAQVMWEKENTRFYVREEEIDEDPELNKFQKMGNKALLGLSHIWEMIMCFFCCLVIIISTIFCIIQYTMTILEYTIVVGIGALFIPLILFDGTKDIPKKFIPVFTAFMVKMIVITICIMFVFYLFIENTVSMIGDDSGMNLTIVAEVFFNAIIAYMLTSNAPKIAQTILTGQPQLSMGEFVAATGAAGMTAAGMAKAGVKGTRTAVDSGITTAGNINRGVKEMNTARKEAGLETGKMALKNGFTNSQARNMANKAAFNAGIKGLADGMIARPTKDLVNKMKEKGNNFLHGNTSFSTLNKVVGKGTWNGNGSNGGGGVGSGQNPHEKPHDFMNGSYKDENGKRTNLTTKEFINEKGKEGQIAGENIGFNSAVKAEEKALAKKNSQAQAKKAESLPENLSGEERAIKK